jgi:hypothetical protein
MKTYNVSGGMSLHDARALLLGTNHKIIHTGKVNSYARCLGSKLKVAKSVMQAREIMASSVGACGGVAGGKKRTHVRKDGRRVEAT